MISGWELYWIMRLSELKTVLFVLSGLGTIVWFGLLLFFVIDDFAEFTEPAKKCFKLGALSLILMWSVGWLIPTTKELCAIKVIPALAQNEKVQELPQKVLEYADEWLKSQLEELQKKKK